MGFFSGIGKLSGLLGGAETASSSGSSASGFAFLPPEIQKAFTDYANQTTGLFANGGANSMFTPMSLNAGEQKGLASMYQGFTPTPQSLQQDISLLSNPFDEYVINAMNREATGANSLVNQAANLAGQQGSNRSFLGTSDVEQNRLNSIGQFKQNQYNTTIDNILSKLIPQRQQDAYNTLTGGTYERTLDSAIRQAPYSALQAYGGLLGALPQSGGGSSTQQSESQGQSGGLGGLLQTAGAISSFFSDRRLKENVEFIGHENGHKIYSFNYMNDSDSFIGVMSDEIRETYPDAVSVDASGYDRVDYDLIGVKFRRNNG